jgi:hypothetical protein
MYHIIKNVDKYHYIIYTNLKKLFQYIYYLYILKKVGFRKLIPSDFSYFVSPKIFNRAIPAFALFWNDVLTK